MQEKSKLPQILDCTLRDGGYYTLWDFNKDLVKNYLESFNQLPVDYLEIGYRSNPMDSYLGEYFYCPPHVLKRCKEISDKKLVIILNEKDVRAAHAHELLSPCIGYIDMVRIAIDPKNFKRALGLAGAVKKMGFEVGFNVMYMSTWESEKEFLSQIKDVQGLADYFYMVDSFGGVYPEDVKNIFNLVQSQTDVKIGFHGHNNLELGLINTLTAIDCGADIVDATVTGMGRGAGNLKTELLLTALNAKNDLEVDFNALGEITGQFSKMQEEYGWGTNLPYMVSGGNSLPQKEVMEWVSKRYYSFNSIIRALNNQKIGVKDNKEYPKLKSNKKFKEALIIGGGPTAYMHSGAIREYVQGKEADEICIIHASSRNANDYKTLSVDQYFCLIGNEGQRLEQVLNNLENFDPICILPPFPRKMGTYVPAVISNFTYELESFYFDEMPKDSATALAIELAIGLQCEEFFVVGYDGYSDTTLGQKEHELFLENDQIFKGYIAKGIKLRSLTPTKYQNLKTQSVYAKF